MQASQSSRTTEQLRRTAEGLARQATLLYRFRAVAWAVVLAVLVTLTLVVIDYLLHLNERGLRWLFSLTWMASLAGIAVYWLREARSFKLTPLEVVGWIERSRPELTDQLTRLLATAQLPDNDLRFGSLQLRQAVLSQSDGAWGNLQWSRYVDRMATLRAALAGAGCLLGIGGLAWFNQPLIGLGIERIVAPWRAAPWPRADQLEFVQLPRIIPMGLELEVQAIDRRPPLPLDIQVQFRRSGALQAATKGASQSSLPQRLPMRLLEEVAVLTLPAMESDFEIRVIGGDDRDSAWQPIKVARRPMLEEHQFTVVPPAYTQQPTLNLVGQRIEILAGSAVTFAGRFDTAVAAVEVIPGVDERSLATNPGNPPAPVLLPNPTLDSAVTDAGARVSWHALLAADGQRFELASAGGAALVVAHDQQWKLAITTKEGLRVTDESLWQLRVVADQAPVATLHPLSTTYMTRQAQLPVTGQALDDLGLTEVALLWRTGTTTETSRRVLWSRPTSSSTSQVEPTQEKAVELATIWPGEQFSPAIGDRIVLELEATDTAGQVSHSLPQTIEVQDDNAVLSQLRTAQAEALSALREIARAQTRATHAIERTQEVVQSAGKVQSADVEALAAAQQMQRSIADALAEAPDSLRTDLADIADQLARNQLEQSPLARELATLSQQIEQLQPARLAPALESLQRASQAMRSAVEHDTSNPPATSELEQAVQDSRNLANDISSLAQSVVVAESLATLQKRVQQLLNEQSAIGHATEQLQVDALLTNDATELASRRTGLRSDQHELARNVIEFMSRLDQELDSLNAKESQESQPAPEVLQRAREQLLTGQTSQRMRQAAEQLENNQLARSLEFQAQAREALQQALNQFNAGTAGGLQGSTDAMESLARELGQLSLAQRQLAERFSEARPDNAADTSLVEQQQHLSQAIAQLAERQANSPSQALRSQLSSASQSAAEAAAAAEQENFAQAQPPAAQAAEQLQAAEQQASQKAEQLRQQLSEQQLLDLAALIDGLVARQTPLVAQLAQLPRDQAQANSNLQLPELIATEQQVLAQLRQGLTHSDSPPTFKWLLSQCDEELVRVIAALQRGRVHPEATSSAQSALDMLGAAQAALAKDPPAAEPTDPTSPSPAEADTSANQQRPGITLSSLRLLRSMQQLLNQQSTQLSQQENPSQAAAAQLATRQQALADQVQQLIEQAASQSSGNN